VDSLDRAIERFLDAQPKPFDLTYAAASALYLNLPSDKALDDLRALVRGLDEVTAGQDDTFDFPVGSEPSVQRRFQPQSKPEEPRLPQRRTHGGPFGPKVREKLMREALGE
jgi:hypothetical protein